MARSIHKSLVQALQARAKHCKGTINPSAHLTYHFPCFACGLFILRNRLTLYYLCRPPNGLVQFLIYNGRCFGKMVKLDILLDEPSIDLSSGFQSRATDVPLSGRLVISLDKPTQFKSASLKYECINSHVDLEVSIPFVTKTYLLGRGIRLL